jgi:hypothetical protein
MKRRRIGGERAEGPRDKVTEDGEPLPTEGLEVEEASDADTASVFMREWRKRIIRDVVPSEATADATEQTPASTAPH